MLLFAIWRSMLSLLENHIIHKRVHKVNYVLSSPCECCQPSLLLNASLLVWSLSILVFFINEQSLALAISWERLPGL